MYLYSAFLVIFDHSKHCYATFVLFFFAWWLTQEPSGPRRDYCLLSAYVRQPAVWQRVMVSYKESFCRWR